MRLRRILIAAVAGVAGLGALTAVAPAAQAAQPPWQPYRSAPFEDPAGDPCPFAVQATPVRDGEQYRTLSTYPDGTPKDQEFRGPLWFRYTNETTGRSVVRDLSGYAVFHYGQDGSLQADFFRHGGVTVHPGNVSYPAGEWVFNAPFYLDVDPNGNRTIVQPRPARENLCRTLA